MYFKTSLQMPRGIDSSIQPGFLLHFFVFQSVCRFSPVCCLITQPLPVLLDGPDLLALCRDEMSAHKVKRMRTRGTHVKVWHWVLKDVRQGKWHQSTNQVFHRYRNRELSPAQTVLKDLLDSS
jgi:hypothetical protein